MSDFWAARLGGLSQPAPATAPAAPVQRPWWANDYVPQVQQPQVTPAAPEPPEEQTQGWGTVAGSTKRAKSARLSDACPECGSSNYFRPEGMANSMLQCYECGYNPRFSQTGGHGGLPSGEAGPAQPARQLATAGAGGVSQFQPQTIIGRA